MQVILQLAHIESKLQRSQAPAVPPSPRARGEAEGHRAGRGAGVVPPGGRRGADRGQLAPAALAAALPGPPEDVALLGWSWMGRMEKEEECFVGLPDLSLAATSGRRFAPCALPSIHLVTSNATTPT